MAPMQTPAVHGVPSGRGPCPAHDPSVASQYPLVWHSSAATHVTGVPLVQVPPSHVSPVVQVLPSLHVVPSATFTFEQVPFEGLHVPAE